jgi:hypothetical protein
VLQVESELEQAHLKKEAHSAQVSPPPEQQELLPQGPACLQPAPAP